MAQSSLTIDREQARSLLNQEWEQVLSDRRKADDKKQYLPDRYCETIDELLECDLKYIKYLLVTNTLAKATNNDSHYLSLKKNVDELSGSHAPRGLAKKVVLNWNVEIGHRLGPSTSEYPLAGNPTAGGNRGKLEPEKHSNDPGLRETLANLLAELQEKTESGELDERDVLREVLNKIVDLEEVNYEFEMPESHIKYIEVNSRLAEFLDKNAGGERVEAVAAGIIDVCWQDSEDTYQIETSHLYAPDKPQKAAGDVGVKTDGRYVLGAEIKPQAPTPATIRTALTVAKENSIPQYLIITKRGVSKNQQEMENIITSSEIDLSVVTIYDMLTWLQPLSTNKRKAVLESISEILEQNDVREETASDWKYCLKTLNTQD